MAHGQRLQHYRIDKAKDCGMAHGQRLQHYRINTAIFSLIDAVMLKSLPVSHPEELVQVTMGSPLYFSNLIWEQIRDRQDVFSGIFAYGKWLFNLAHGGEVRFGGRRRSIPECTYL